MRNTVDTKYLELCAYVLEHGKFKEDRTGTGTYSVFGYQMRLDLSEGFPLLTTKRVPFRLIVSELLWFLKGDTNIKYLLEHNNGIWNEWGFEKWVNSIEYTGPDMTDFGRRCLIDPVFNELYQKELETYKHMVLTDEEFSKTYGDLGNVYGKQWRSWVGADGKTYDQIQYVIDEIKNNPNSRRIICNAWNISELASQQLPPCHFMIQFYVHDGKLTCMFQMRSTDVFLGLPFNIASYALLTHIIAAECGLEVGELIYNGGDVHIYSNHVEQVQQQLLNEPYQLPILVIENKKPLDSYNVTDFNLVDYVSHGTIKAPVAV